MSGERDVLRQWISRIAGTITLPDSFLQVISRDTTASGLTCDATKRGALRRREGATTVADTLSVCHKDTADAYAWETVATVASADFDDEGFALHDDGDATKRVQFEASGITTATTRVLTVPDADGTLALTADVATLAATTPVIVGTNTATWATGNIAAGGAATTDIAVAGALTSDDVRVSHTGTRSQLVQLELDAYVAAADTVRVVVRNHAGTTQSISSGTVRATVMRDPD